MQTIYFLKTYDSHYPLTTWWQLGDHLVNLGHHLVTTWWPLDDHLGTIPWPLGDTQFFVSSSSVLHQFFISSPSVIHHFFISSSPFLPEFFINSSSLLDQVKQARRAQSQPEGPLPRRGPKTSSCKYFLFFEFKFPPTKVVKYLWCFYYCRYDTINSAMP